MRFMRRSLTIKRRCSSLWIGKSAVPDKTNSSTGIDDHSYFAKKPTDKAIQRGSWGLEIDQPLFMPPGDPHEQHRRE